MYLVDAQISFSKILLLVLPLCCSPPERNLRAESRFVHLVFGKETVTGCWSAGSGPLAGLPQTMLSAGRSLSGSLNACNRQWCLNLPSELRIMGPFIIHHGREQANLGILDVAQCTSQDKAPAPVPWVALLGSSQGQRYQEMWFLNAGI